MPVTVPFALGLSITATVQCAPAAILAPQVLLAIEKFVVVVMLEKFKATL